MNSTIPTLVLQGRYDVQTNSEMGIQVMEGLRNGTFVELSSTGHGAIVASQCAKDIGVAFVNNPDRTPRYALHHRPVPRVRIVPRGIAWWVKFIAAGNTDNVFNHRSGVAESRNESV